MESPLAKEPVGLIEAQEDSTSGGTEDAQSTTSSAITTGCSDPVENDAGSSNFTQGTCNVEENHPTEEIATNSGASEASPLPLTASSSESHLDRCEESSMGLKLGKGTEQKSEEREEHEDRPGDRDEYCEATSTVECYEKINIDETVDKGGGEGGGEECYSADSSLTARKRLASDFLPIGAEIKRIGVEISEEQANQLRCEVRRISPVLISQRERTLPEISLSSDSCLFDDSGDSRCRSNGILEESFSNSANLTSRGGGGGGGGGGGTLENLDTNAEAEVLETKEDCRISSVSSSEVECTSSVEDAVDSTNKLCYVENAVLDEDSCCSATEELCREVECQEETAESRASNSSSSLGNASTAMKYSEPMAALSPDSSLRRLVVTVDRVTNLPSTKPDTLQDEDSCCSTREDPVDIHCEAECKTTTDINGSLSDSSSLKVSTVPSADSSISSSPRRLVVLLERVCMFSSPQARRSETKRENIETNEEESNTPAIRTSPRIRIGNHVEQQQVESSSIVSNSRETIDRIKKTRCLKPCTVLIERLPIGEDGQIKNMAVRKQQSKLRDDEMASRAVIEKLEEDEEVVFSSSSPVEDDLQRRNEADSCEARPRSPEEILGSTVEVAESVDTETETETVSDSSEVSSMTNVRLRGCDDEATSDQISCQENETLCCDETSPEIMTRLEPERPEPFTEDSAESLALAAGARDEVRSDGSDSGLGGEIPGDPGPAPVPESDSETSFLDRLPDDILSDKEKAVNQLESFVPSTAVPGTPHTPLTNFRSPPKSNLKRRLSDCMEGEPSPKRSNTEQPMKKKRNIQFDAVTVYYFPRAQGFTCVPSQGGSTLGMSATHTHAERFSLSEHAAEQRRIHRARLAQLRSERAANCVIETASSSEDPSDDTDEEPSDNEELDIDSYYFLQPVPTWQRRALLRAAGVRRIDGIEKDECRDIRASREHCGCGCKVYCDPESCPCSRANVKCQVDRAGFPCGCTRDGCANSSGRIEFNPVRVRTHFIHTLMRLELEKKQREEDGTEHDVVSDNQNGRGPLREINLGSVMENTNSEACINGGGFTTLHYENHDGGDGGANCQPEVPGTREDSLDLYAIRDDCYPSEDAVDGTQASQRKLHPEFSQAFQTFSGQTAAGVNFQPSAYQDYQPYANIPSTSRVQFQPQFQTVPGNPGFSHYGAYNQDTGSIQGSCQVHPGHNSTGYEATFAQDETTGSQYTNLNSVQPMNSVVQQMGKLEPFSELLSGRYSYYGEMEPQAHGTYHGNGTKVGVEKGPSNEQPAESTEECDENFGEIIKKSMVETVSA